MEIWKINLKRPRTYLWIGIFYTILSAGCDRSKNDADCQGEWDSTIGKEVLTFTEEMPQFGKGIEDVSSYIADNFRYPNSKEEFQAGFNIRFIVDTDGKAKYFEIKSKSNEERWITDESHWTVAEKAMIETLRKMPAWKPGRCNGKEVAVRMFLPIRF